MVYLCTPCDKTFKSKKCLQQHLKCSRHTERMNKPSDIPKYECGVCGKKYIVRQSFQEHKKSCVDVTAPPVQLSVTETIEELKNTVLEEQKKNKLEREFYRIEREKFQKEQTEILNELRSQIASLLDKHAGSNNHSNSNSNNTNNTIETQVNININAFGNENTEYLDDKAILDCISRVYKSIPSLVEKIHFDPKHPENHNIKITNKKLPYASVMGNNKKWKTVDRKDAIDTMVNNSYYILDDKFKEHKDKISESKQDHFRGFQSRFDREDKELMKEIKSEVDMMVLNGV